MSMVYRSRVTLSTMKLVMTAMLSAKPTKPAHHLGACRTWAMARSQPQAASKASGGMTGKM